MPLAREKLISRLEGIVWKNIYNNNNQIRYPITFRDGSKLKGRYILRVSEKNIGKFYSGRYIFGANELYIYQALAEILDFLDEEGADILEVELNY
jgi:hypothetical protein